VLDAFRAGREERMLVQLGNVRVRYPRRDGEVLAVVTSAGASMEHVDSFQASQDDPRKFMTLNSRVTLSHGGKK
jgi:hypothetical protein